MAQEELKMPKMGESVHEATIIRWLKNEGEMVEADETLLEIATDKVDSEVPSTSAGILVKKLFNDGDVVQVGTVIAIISTDGSAPSPSSNGSAKVESPAPAPVAAPVMAAAPVVAAAPAPVATTIQSNGVRFYSPLVRTIASTEGISQGELDTIPGTGAEGRVTKNDILGFVDLKKKGGAPAPMPVAAMNWFEKIDFICESNIFK